MKRWIVYPKKSDDIIEQLLVNRGVKDKERFLNPDYDQDLHDPNLFKHMKRAVARIKKAMKHQEKIGIFADYDADGIPGAALLSRVFGILKCPVAIYIPSREEGYGLNEKGIKELHKNGCTLLITVDLGIVNDKEVKLAKKLGLDVIICDHHEIQKTKIPRQALAILHPRLSPRYPNKDLSGCAVAYKLCQGLSLELKRPTINELKWLLDLPAISLVADCLPLLGENRTMVKYGLIILSKTKNPGLQELYSTASIDQKNVNTYTIGFQIAPRINAPGRIKNANVVLRLLTAKNKKSASQLAAKINKLNQERQKQLDKILNEAEQKIHTKNLGDKKIIMVDGEKWPLGIIGLVAGKLMEKYFKPVLIFSRGKTVSRGSARSIQTFHILEALGQAKQYLLKHGGHAQAAGVTLENKHLQALYDKLLEIAESRLKFKELAPKISVDKIISPQSVNFDLINQLKKFEPHGLGNPKPIFLINNVVVEEKRRVGGKGQHLKLLLRLGYNNLALDSIGFDLGELDKELTIGGKIDIVFSLNEDHWNGNHRLQLVILDLKKSGQK